MMRGVIFKSMLVITAGLMVGCGTSGKPQAAGQMDPAAAYRSCVMQSGGVNVLKLVTAPQLKCAAKEGSLHFTDPQYEVEVWLINGAATVDQGVAKVSGQIVDEFKDFKPEQTTDLTIAGNPAKRLVGSGHEADDGDPGDADVIVFTVSGRVFVACSHGESLNPLGEKAMLAIVQTAQLP